jgi:hypothetical protein
MNIGGDYIIDIVYTSTFMAALVSSVLCILLLEQSTDFLDRLLPVPLHAPAVSDDESDLLPIQPSQSLIQRHVIPPYGQRKGWKPSTQDDFGDGGAYPECHVAQYPLELGRKKVRRVIKFSSYVC